MAHRVARQIKGPRSDGMGGDNSYENLILLCPTCHTHIDKNPAGFPLGVLVKWKTDHEAFVISRLTAQEFTTLKSLIHFMYMKLSENQAIFQSLGPHSEVATNDPSSNAHSIWIARVLDTIIPNNSMIVASVDSFKPGLPVRLVPLYADFKNHASAYEDHTYDRKDSYPLFPRTFGDMIKEIAEHGKWHKRLWRVIFKN